MADPSWPAEINLAFVEGLYADYLRDPMSVSPEWRGYFQSVSPHAKTGVNGATLNRLPPLEVPEDQQAVQAAPVAQPTEVPPAHTVPSNGAVGLQDRVDKLVRAYRVRGHMVAKIDPLGLPRPTPPQLDPSFYGLHPDDMDRKISRQSLSGCSLDTPRLVIERLRETYTRSVGVQFMHIDDLGVREWLQKRMESVGNHVQLSQARQLRILTKLTDATIF